MIIKLILKGFLLFLMSAFLTLILMETYIRFAEIESLSNFEVDSIQGKKLRPNVNMLYLNEGFYMGKTNSLGYLGPDYPKKKNLKNYRIALMGDSYVESFELFDRHSLRTYIEKDLDSLFSTGKVEVLNFGRSGYNLRNIYAYYKNFASDFNADIYLVFLNNSDFYDTIPKSLLPNIRLKNDELIVDNSFINSKAFRNYSLTRFFRENSVYLKIVNNILGLIQSEVSGKIIFGKIYEFFENHRNRQNPKIATETPIPDPLPEMTLNIIKSMAEKQRFILILNEKPTLPIQQVLECSEISKIELYTLLHTMKEAGNNPYFWPATQRYGHWNQMAHKRIGEEIVKELMARYGL